MTDRKSHHSLFNEFEIQRSDPQERLEVRSIPYQLIGQLFLILLLGLAILLRSLY